MNGAGPPGTARAVRQWLAERDLPPRATHVAQALHERGSLGSPSAVLAATRAVTADLAGAGSLQVILDDPAVTDVVVQRGGEIWVDRGSGFVRAVDRLDGEAAVRALAVRMVATGGQRLDAAVPYADAVLPDGHRVHAIVPPLAGDGTCLSIRALRPHVYDFAALTSALPVDLTRWLRALLAAGTPTLLSGATGAGKTTLLNAMLGELDPGLRLVLVEDSGELRPRHPHVVRLRSREPNVEGAGAVPLRTLLRQALRMRPDRLVLGEVRGAEVIELLVALNTGHTGGLCTLHANSAQEIPARLEALAALGGMPRASAHSLLAPALRAVVHLSRAGSARHVDEIGVLSAHEDGLVRCTTAIRRQGAEVVRGPAYSDLAALAGSNSPLCA